MKYVNMQFATNASEQPIKSGTVDFVQQSYQELAVNQAAATIGFLNNYYNALGYGTYDATYGALSPTTPYVVSGCILGSYGGGKRMFGEILWNNSVYRVLPNTISYTSGPLYASFLTSSSVTLDPTTFSDFTPHNVHNDITIQFGTSSVGSIFQYTDLVYPTSVGTQINNAVATLTPLIYLGSWINLPLATGWTATSYVPQYRTDGVGRIYLRGTAVAGSGATSVLGTLPTGFWPTYQMNFPCYCNLSGTPGVSFVDINGAGVVSVGGAYTSGNIWAIDGIVFLNS